jgi:hypothetical protein
MFLFGLSAACLAWMLVVVKRLTRDAAPRLAEELDTGGLPAAPALAAIAGGAVPPCPLARGAIRAVPAGSE